MVSLRDSPETEPSLEHGFATTAREWVRWHVNRLRCMTPAEIGHRVLRRMFMCVEHGRWPDSERVPPPDLTIFPRAWVHAASEVDTASYLAAADAIAAGKLSVFALREADLGSPPRWNCDPKTGVEAPLAFGMTLDYRNPRLVGDIKYLWEINRHAHLVTLAQGYMLSGDRRYFEVIREHLESWFSSCPYPLGPNWSSALEAAIRLINWSVTWQLLGAPGSPLFEDKEGQQLRRRWLSSVYQHSRFVHSYFSLYSSANNHLIGEAAGLFIGALTWPYWPDMRAWRAKAKTILEREARLQNAPDGVNLEQAVSYQQFVLDLLLLTLRAGRANGEWFSVIYEARIEAMLEYLASIMDSGGNVPMFGDSDDALVVRFTPDTDYSRARLLLAIGAALFQCGDFRAKAGTLPDNVRWLFGDQARRMFEDAGTVQAQPPPRQAFSWGGYYILGRDFDTEQEIRLVVDAGPLGYQSIAAHGHADALAFTLSMGRREFLIDPGTYAYHTQQMWRRYFRGTRAHNTLSIDGEDQSEQGGNFMWLKKARAGCKLWSSTGQQDMFEGWHDGYMRLADPVMHRRRITLDKTFRRIYIQDHLNMRAEHVVTLCFHCSEHCRVEPIADGYTLRQAGCQLTIKLPRQEGGSACVYCGSVAPVWGWVSRRFDEKRPAPTIVWQARLRGPTVLHSEIIC